MSKIPHPFISESMELFKSLSEADKAKINFIHFNHTNPVLMDGSESYKQVIDSGFKIAWESQAVYL
jgi:pyrroloquinoline quinone biosynthesis protein B